MDKNILFKLFRYWKNSSAIFLFSIIGLSSFRCSQESDRTLELNLLVRIGDRIITVDDFIHRSEYTIRPPYCRNNTYIHKKIILNSLVAEKLFALEEGDSNALVSNADFIDYVQGRKEQAMRKIHYYEESYKQIELSEKEIAEETERSLRRYSISYFSIKEEKLAEIIRHKLFKENVSFSDIYYQLAGDTLIPSREVKWDKPEREEIYNSLFHGMPKINEIIGPVSISDEQFIFMRVNGWIDSKILTEAQFNDRSKIVSERLTEQKAWSDYQSIVGKIMQEKRLEFNHATFKRVYELTAPLYIKLEEEKKNFINNSIWEMAQSDSQFIDFPKQLDDLNSAPFFVVDNKAWTVADFRKLMKRHPLVFRKELSGKSTLREQFRFAIVDMIRDYYITQDAYEKEYDLCPAVIQEKTIWEDNLLSLYHKFNFISEKNTTNSSQTEIDEDYLTPYVENLFVKYDAEIEINIKKFEEIKFSNIDMMAFQTDQPFPVVVPSFPLLTNKNRLDYGKILNANKK